MIGNFLGAIISPLAQWVSGKLWRRFFSYLDSRAAAKKVDKVIEQPK